jgi:hypothetical protein
MKGERMRIVTRKRCNRSTRRMLCFGLLACTIASGVAHADEPVDTAYQARGTAPRLEFEVGAHFDLGLGHACRTQPPASAATMATTNDTVTEMAAVVVAAESCSATLPLLGGEALVLLRPANHWAFGPELAYDVVFGAHHVTVDSLGAQGDYARHALRLSAELRWYSRKVAPGGLFLAFKAGILWWSETLAQVTTKSETQSAPQFGFEVGGMFVPYRGVGMTLALHSWLGLLRDAPTVSNSATGGTYGYGPFVFLGLSARLALSVGLR